VVRAPPAVVVVLPSQAHQLADIVDAHPPGSTYKFLPGLYRLPLDGIPAKDGDTFEGATSCAPDLPQPPDHTVLGGGAAWRQATAEVRRLCEAKGAPPTVLTGAVLLSNATRDSSTGLWVVSGLTSLDSGQHGPCAQSSPACGFRNELFLGDRLLHRADALANVSAMSWFVRYDTPNPSGALSLPLCLSASLPL
jgi:hypothetical protein